MMRVCQVWGALAVLAPCLVAACDGETGFVETGFGGAGGQVSAGGGASSDSGPLGMSLAPKPADLSTGHDGAAVVISATCQSFLPPGAPAPGLSLRTHPGDVVVPVTLESMVLDASPGPPCGWVLHPLSPLGPSWYALVLEGGAFTWGHQRTDGAWESRFRVGSQPLLIAVSACASDNDQLLPKVRLDFSEGVTLPAGEPPIDVLVDGKPASCALYDPPSDQSPSLGLTCSPPIPAGAAVTVTVGTGIVSAASGLPLETSSGPLPKSFELPPIAQYAACRYWRETVVPAE